MSNEVQAGAKQTMRVVNALPYTIDSSDTRPFWMKVEPSEDTEVIRGYGAVVEGKPGEPHYMKRRDKQKERAEAVAEAVRLAVERGDIDPSVFE